jgi:hypothetical protein
MVVARWLVTEVAAVGGGLLSQLVDGAVALHELIAFEV